MKHLDVPQETKSFLYYLKMFDPHVHITKEYKFS